MKNNKQQYENNRLMRVVVGVISITISLAMVGYVVQTIFILSRKKMESTKNPTRIEEVNDTIYDEKELVKKK